MRTGLPGVLAGISAALWLALTALGCPAAAETIELWNRQGGYTHLHMKQADQWLAHGTKLVIRDWQVSAAAIQVLYFKRRGGQVCYGKSGFNGDPALFFHTAESRGKPRNELAHYIGAGNAAKVGGLSPNRLKRFHPSAFGIKACAAGTRGETRTARRPPLMRW